MVRKKAVNAPGLSADSSSQLPSPVSADDSNINPVSDSSLVPELPDHKAQAPSTWAFQKEGKGGSHEDDEETDSFADVAKSLEEGSDVTSKGASQLLSASSSLLDSLQQHFIRMRTFVEEESASGFLPLRQRLQVAARNWSRGIPFVSGTEGPNSKLSWAPLSGWQSLIGQGDSSSKNTTPSLGLPSASWNLLPFLALLALLMSAVGYVVLWGESVRPDGDLLELRAMHTSSARFVAPSDTCVDLTRTRSGLCVGTLFQAYDEVYRELWPGGMDLLIRTRLGHEEHELNILFRSIGLFWPKGLGDVVVVLDDDDTNRAAAVFLPRHVKVFFEPNPLGLVDSVRPQWSAMWADNYTTSQFVALADGDLLLVTKVVPSLLFNLTERVPYLLGINFTVGPDRQYAQWRGSSQYFIGEEEYFTNFMVNMPFTVTRSVFAGYRAHVAAHTNTSFDEAMRWWSNNGEPDKKKMNFQTLIGNYIRGHEPEKVHIVQENSAHTPIPRVGVHLPFAKPLRSLTAKRDKGHPEYDHFEYQRQYTVLAANYTREALCDAFPLGELSFCPQRDNETFATSLAEHRVLWTSVFEWLDWEMMVNGENPNATVVYDTYKEEMHCLYRKYVGHSHDGIPPSIAGNPVDCIRSQVKLDVGSEDVR